MLVLVMGGYVGLGCVGDWSSVGVVVGAIFGVQWTALSGSTIVLYNIVTIVNPSKTKNGTRGDDSMNRTYVDKTRSIMLPTKLSV